MTEQWRPVPGFEGLYEISDLGQVRGLDRTLRDGRRWKGRLLRHNALNFGHHIVNLSRDGKAEPWLVHRLVALAFLGPPPFEGALVRHLSGEPDDNRVENLAWGTASENCQDTVRHGRHVQANRTSCPYGHPLEDWNLEAWTLKQGGRKCLACARARTTVRRRPHLDFAETAAWYVQREIDRRKREQQ